MGQSFELIVTVVAGVFLVMVIGAAVRRVGWLNREADTSIIRLTINVLLPALILSVVPGNPKLAEPGNLIVPPMVGFGTVAGGFGISLLMARMLGRTVGLGSGAARRTFAVCTGIYNYGFVPLPLALALFDTGTAAVLFVHNLGVEIAMWTLGILLLTGHLGSRWYLRLVNGPSVAIALALVLHATGWHAAIPGFIRKYTIEPLGLTAIPISLLMVGATVADEFEEARFAAGWSVIGLAGLLRLLILPMSFLALAWALPISRELKAVIALEASMPSAVFPVVLSRHYGGHPPTAVRIVVGTAVLSLLTTPLWLSAGLAFLGLSTRSVP